MHRLLCLLTCMAACSVVSGVGDFEVGLPVDTPAHAGGGGAGGGGGVGGAEPTCPAGRGPAMVVVDGSWGPYCVDRTEVSNAQYAEFLASNPETTVSDVRCGWKLDYIPRNNLGSCLPQHSDAAAFPGHPIACVDWCDARKFCNWAGKRLCGSATGSAIPYPNLTDLANDEWYFACTAGGTLNYPYGNNYNPNACVGDDFDGVPGDGADDEAQPVGSANACKGGAAGLLDMSGNLHEWVDSCEDVDALQAFDQRCRARGGSFWDPASDLTCAASFDFMTRDYFAKNFGFRCCAGVEEAL
jgi:sulfatase modifying factor 1